MKKVRSLNISIVYPGRFPWNRGIGQLYDLLEDLGHNPVVFSRATEKRFLRAKRNDFSFEIMREGDSLLKRIRTYPVAINPFWRKFVAQGARTMRADCIFVRETNVLNQAVAAARSLKIPVFVDMRENMGLLFTMSKTNRSLNLIRTEGFINFIEQIYLRQCDHIFTVTEELKQWIIGKYGINREDVSVLGNYPDKNYISQAKNIHSIGKSEFNSPVKFVYIGALAEGKGLQKFIRSLPIVNQKHDCTFTIIGEGEYRKNLEDLVQENNLKNKVFFKPLLPPDEVIQTLAEFDIGVCPYLVNRFSNQTMPGKLFEYMCVGLPVLSSARKTVSRIIKETACGVIYESQEPKEIADKMVAMINNPVRTLTMGLNGRKAVFTKYNGETSKTVVRRILERYFKQ
jgi:glycosyltransferase involved in cell wall biosynthesis